MSKIITTHLTLDAPVEGVWEALTTLPAYGEWNPFITQRPACWRPANVST